MESPPLQAAPATILQEQAKKKRPGPFRSVANHWADYMYVMPSLLVMVLVGVFLPQQWRLGTDAFHVSVGSLVMVLAAVVSYYTTPKPLHEANETAVDGSLVTWRATTWSGSVEVSPLPTPAREADGVKLSAAWLIERSDIPTFIPDRGF